jgi:hypothetical protein
MSLKDVASEGISSAAPYIALGSDASTQVGTRQAASWNTSADGQITASNLSFTGLAANQSVSHVLLYSASTGGTLVGAIALTGDSSANAAGEYTVTSVTVTVS